MPSLWLMYHDIFGERPLSGWPPSVTTYHVSGRQFAQHLDIIQQSGKAVLPASIALKNLDQISVVLSFDDGWHGVMENVLPQLVPYGWQAIFFITRDFVGKPGFLDEAAIREISACGMEIGVHGTTHRALSTCSAAEIFTEFQTCKDYLENLLGREISIAALPGGDQNKKVTEIAIKAGIKTLCTSIPGINTRLISPFQLRRMTIRRGTSPEALERYCEFRVLPEVIHWMVLEFPKKLFGIKNYMHLRRMMMGEYQDCLI